MRVHVGSPCVFLVRRFAANRDRERAVTISQLMLVGTLPDKLNLNGHGRSSISNGVLDAHHDANHRSRLCPARPGKCAPGGPSQSSAAKQSPGRATHRPAIPRSAPPSSAGSITGTARPAVLLE